MVVERGEMVYMTVCGWVEGGELLFIPPGETPASGYREHLCGNWGHAQGETVPLGSDMLILVGFWFWFLEMGLSV